MEKEKVKTFLKLHDETFSSEDKGDIRQKLELVEEQKLERVADLKFTSPKKAWILSLTLGCFGVSGFVSGRIKTGVARVIFTVLSIINLVCFFVKCSPWLSALFNGGSVPGYASDYFLSFKIIFLLLTLVNLALGIEELCVIKEKTKEKNFKKFLTEVNA